MKLYNNTVTGGAKVSSGFSEQWRVQARNEFCQSKQPIFEANEFLNVNVPEAGVKKTTT